MQRLRKGSERGVRRRKENEFLKHFPIKMIAISGNSQHIFLFKNPKNHLPRRKGSSPFFFFFNLNLREMRKREIVDATFYLQHPRAAQASRSEQKAENLLALSSWLYMFPTAYCCGHMCSPDTLYYFITIYSTIWYCTVLYYNVQYYITLYVLYYTVQYCIILFSTILHCTVRYYTVK